MRAYDSNSKSVLPAIRHYFQVLVATVVILSLSFIGYFYWLNNLRLKLEVVANFYHLETMLYCSQIKEELMHILPADPHSQFYMKRSSWQDRSQIAHNNSLYLIEQYIQTINEMHETYAAASGQDTQPRAHHPQGRQATRQDHGRATGSG